MRYLPVVLALVLLAFEPPAAKADPSAAQETILSQLEAFRSRDAAGAYAYAAPSIKRMFPTPERFIDMARRGYAPVFDARRPVFLRSQSIDADRYAQEVGFSDGEGRAWTALYTLAKQPDGTWRITGCYLRKAAGQAI